MKNSLIILLIIFSCESKTKVAKKGELHKSDSCKYVVLSRLREEQILVRSKILSNRESDRLALVNQVFSCNKDVLLGKGNFTRIIGNPNIFRWYHLTFSNIWTKELIFDFTHIPRNSANIRYLFNLYKEQVYDFFNADMYEKTGVKITIRDLLKSYKVFKKKANAREFEGLIFKDNVIEYFTKMAYAPEMLKDGDFKPEPNYQYNSWLYSFWYRRHLEGNMETVYEILKEINEHYQKRK